MRSCHSNWQRRWLLPGTMRFTTGNMQNSILLPLVLSNLYRVEAAFQSVAYVELTASTMIAHA